MKSYNKEDLKVITQDPRFHIVEDIIKDYISPLLDIKNIDTTASPEVIAAEINVRKHMVGQLESLLADLGLLKTVLDRKPNSCR